ncbi:MAG: M23 family metallopeptidase, partial [Pigmentiphaga sp.]
PEETYRIETPEAQGGPMVEAEPVSFEQLEAEVLTLEQRLSARADHLAVLDFRLSDLVASHQLTPSRMPIEGYRYRSSSFGPRFDPINRRRAFHEGIDFAAPRGTPIYAAAGGVVRTAKYLRGYGNTIEIDHGDRLTTRYAHASRLLVKSGQVIKRGQQVATVGSTGRSTGPHLHFEVRVDGQAADPRLYLAGAANPLTQALARAE